MFPVLYSVSLQLVLHAVVCTSCSPIPVLLFDDETDGTRRHVLHLITERHRFTQWTNVFICHLLLTGSMEVHPKLLTKTGYLHIFLLIMRISPHFCGSLYLNCIVDPQYLCGIGFRKPTDTKVHGCSSGQWRSICI